MATKKNTSKIAPSKSPFDSIKSFFDTVTENVADGASIVSSKIKSNSAKAFVAGTELVDEASKRIHEYSDKVSLQKEEKTITLRQEEIIHEFGTKTLHQYLNKEAIHKSFLTTKGIQVLVDEYNGNLKNLVAIEKKLKKLNA